MPLVRNIEIIGEAANNLQKMDSNFAANHPELPWIEIRGMRNKVIHNYFDVDWGVVWTTVRDDLLKLKQQINLDPAVAAREAAIGLLAAGG
jgi:uncharacterized protein with HEPN domain